MKGTDLLFGDAVPEVVARIVGQAVKDGSAQSFRDAAQQIRGIQRFIIFMQLGPGFSEDTCLRLSNEQTRLERLAMDSDLRRSLSE